MKYFMIKDETYGDYYKQGFIEADGYELGKMLQDDNLTIMEIESYFDNKMDESFIKYKVESEEGKSEYSSKPEICYYCVSLNDSYYDEEN